VNLKIREFEDGDYQRHAEISAAIEPGSAWSAEMLRHRDSTHEPRVRLVRLVAEVEPTGVVGIARVLHTWWNFHPRRYMLRIEVEPDWQRRGIGSALFERLLGQLRDWDAELVRTETRESRPADVAFLEHRGFREWHRRWDSVLDVARADTAVLLTADRRAATSGVTITSFAAEHARRGDRLARDLYDTESLIFRDEPANAEAGDTPSFDRYASTELDAPDALPEANFVALIGERVIGVSRMMRDLNHPGVLRVAFTGVHPEFRGRGIAQALKLRTIEYARDRGYEQIRTGNDSTNEPMLHINDAIGFYRESATLILERRLDLAPAQTQLVQPE
jgi:GNAT superfamily N-acetyltransferase